MIPHRPLRRHTRGQNRRWPLVVLGLALTPVALHAETLATSAGPVEIRTVATGLDEPWGLGFLPDGGFLVTERSGTLRHFRPDRSVVSVSGLPEIAVDGQGGLLDVMIPRDFATSREVFLSYAKPQPQGAGTALGSARLSADGSRLEGFRLLFEMKEGNAGGVHFGSRIIEAGDGSIFLTMGERGDGKLAQSLAHHNGKVVRINRDGSVPRDNPFVGTPDALPEIWSYGHRNPQGAALDLAGNLWVNEHGAKGGDEVNVVTRGANYGWPVITYGVNYNGRKIGIGTENPGMEQPVHYWDPSIAPSGMLVYSGKLWPEWSGDFFIGSLKFDYIARLDPDNGFAEERIEAPETGRVRDVREAPDGSIWFLSVNEGAVFQLSR